MQIGASAIVMTELSEKLDFSAIKKAVAQIKLPPIVTQFEELFIAVVVRPDDWYPLEHYSINGTLYLSLPLDIEAVRSLTPSEVTALVTRETAAYVAGITEVEEREYEEMEE